MKNIRIQVFWLILLLIISNSIAYGSIKEFWKGDFGDEIREIFAIDINNNGTKEILLIHNEANKNLSIIEWNKYTFKEKFRVHEPKYSLGLKYYDFNNSLFIEKFSLKEKRQFNILIYKNGEYAFTKIKEAQIPSWRGEEYISSGSFRKKGAHDVIITSSYGGNAFTWYLYLREAFQPYNLLWFSSSPIKKGGVQIFGDFDGDKKIELLIIPYEEEIGFMIYHKEKGFEVKEIKSYRKSKYKTVLPLFPLYSSNPEKYVKVGRSVSKDFDEIFFIEPTWPFAFGGLHKAVWHKDRFEFQMLLPAEKLATGKGTIGYEDLNLADIDSDGLDEIIVSEIRGDLKETEEEPDIVKRRDVIHILKWNGKEYKKIWTSKPLGAITQILVDDVTGDGKKEIVVGNDKGEIHIFGQK